MALAMVLMIVLAKYRFQRLTGYLAHQGSATGANMQGIQGKYAVGPGGWFGVGLGASRASGTFLNRPPTSSSPSSAKS